MLSYDYHTIRTIVCLYIIFMDTIYTRTWTISNMIYSCKYSETSPNVDIMVFFFMLSILHRTPTITPFQNFFKMPFNAHHLAILTVSSSPSCQHKTPSSTFVSNLIIQGTHLPRDVVPSGSPRHRLHHPRSPRCHPLGWHKRHVPKQRGASRNPEEKNHRKRRKRSHKGSHFT